ncbi:SulP family inorganic anion transporter [Marinimicrobium sp. ABcell2]|uniref:SulP family inorganic anion transporter n=1 Tax=Marinimicrobium sp. ABcell2 TaxID=3069751 RepID=UPI0027B40AC6|nr:sulfate permease [Marinimicrobium sp. ABcell2]MDQ2077806.1 sulfate permease [Marinimicrobium sp. ABcell2]
MKRKSNTSSLLPPQQWLRQYDRRQFLEDLLAGCITAALLIPQGLAYAILAGLPPQVGLYASILPPLIYALLGTSRTLSVGPVSVAALLVANAIGGAPEQQYLADALLLAFLSGAVLLFLALLRLDVLVNFISHPALSGFISAAAVLIILSQLGNLLGIAVPAGAGYEMLMAVAGQVGDVHVLTAALGLFGILAIALFNAPVVRLLVSAGVDESHAKVISRIGPLALVVALTAIAAGLNLDQRGLAVIGSVPSGLPQVGWDFLQYERALQLLPSAILISIISYVESVSIAKAFAHRRRQKINNNQELVALGASNIAASFTGGMPVAGSFGRSSVNFTAGAQTQIAGVIAALWVALVALFFTHWFYYLPKMALAAVIILAVVRLFDWRAFVNAYRFDRADGLTLLATFFGVLGLGIELGLLLGVIVALAAFLWRSSRPHVVIVGRVPGTSHFRNQDRHRAETWPHLLLLRVDRSLFFANMNYVEDLVAERAAEEPELEHLVLICSAVNSIDYSALEILEQLTSNLRDAGITVHLAEVKGPILDRLQRHGMEEWFAPGKIFFSTEEAVEYLTGASRPV